MSDFEIERAPADDIPWKSETSDTLPYLSPGNGAQPKASPDVGVPRFNGNVEDAHAAVRALLFCSAYSLWNFPGAFDLNMLRRYIRCES